MICQNCGFEFEEGVFCPECGTKLEGSGNQSLNKDINSSDNLSTENIEDESKGNGIQEDLSTDNNLNKDENNIDYLNSSSKIYDYHDSNELNETHDIKTNSEVIGEYSYKANPIPQFTYADRKKQKTRNVLSYVMLGLGIASIPLLCAFGLGILVAIPVFIISLFLLITNKENKIPALFGTICSAITIIIMTVIIASAISSTVKETKTRNQIASYISAGEYDLAYDLVSKSDLSESVKEEYNYDIYVGKGEFDKAALIWITKFEKKGSKLDISESELNKVSSIYDNLTDKCKARYDNILKLQEEEKAAAEQAAKEQAEREAAEKAAAEQAAKEQAEKEAAEKAAAEQAAKEQAEKETAEKAAAEQAAKEQAEKEAAEKAAAEQAAKEQAEKKAAEEAKVREYFEMDSSKFASCYSGKTIEEINQNWIFLFSGYWTCSENENNIEIMYQDGTFHVKINWEDKNLDYIGNYDAINDNYTLKCMYNESGTGINDVENYSNCSIYVDNGDGLHIVEITDISKEKYENLVFYRKTEEDSTAWGDYDTGAPAWGDYGPNEIEDYNDFLRYSDSYIDEEVSVTIKVEEVYKNGNKQYIRGYFCKYRYSQFTYDSYWAVDDYDYYFVIEDSRVNGVRILKDDYIQVTGTYKGEESFRLQNSAGTVFDLVIPVIKSSDITITYDTIDEIGY